jgi:hypothetical protein
MVFRRCSWRGAMCYLFVGALRQAVAVCTYINDDFRSDDERTGKRKDKRFRRPLRRRLAGRCTVQTLSMPRGSPGYSRTCSNMEEAHNSMVPSKDGICQQLWGVSINYIS